ncbi:acyl-coenzyme A diphosphatase NUDT19-like [Uranotaenia lowii]|uniref:acyl-coenzyme A diphosphatase NUDT19-like n=1 Tax=Uranotaenia lowii TaxID=190385 RepID=UPI002479BDA8|nr:acyl-coenzyme A diphosphatase NUDT19-like [Uranotaenia lowii]
MRKFAKYWRDSASLLILARDGTHAGTKNNYNYKVLVFKRTEKTSFMPNSIVFPGGAFDKQDETPHWNGFFKKHGISDDLLKNVTNIAGPRPFIFENDSGDALDRNLSLRLTALRESFEELGVFLGHSGQENSKPSANGYSKAVKNFDIISWQKWVHDNEKPFMELCESTSIVPDVFNMYEWSVWLTPTMFRKRRFETVFYLVALEEETEVVPEAHEVQEHFWDTPQGLLQAHREEKIWLAPPQCYEMTRLSHIYDIDEIVSFAKARNNLGSPLFCPVQLQCSDAAVFLLPGDDLYPQDYDYITPHKEELDKFKNLTAEQLRSQNQNLHRTEHTGLHAQRYFQTVTPFNGHLSLHGDNKHLAKL